MRWQARRLWINQVISQDNHNGSSPTISRAHRIACPSPRGLLPYRNIFRHCLYMTECLSSFSYPSSPGPVPVRNISNDLRCCALLRLAIKMISSIPAATASSTIYCNVGLSTSGSNSLVLPCWLEVLVSPALQLVIHAFIRGGFNAHS